MSRKFPAGIATGSLVSEILQYAKENCFALPAVNVTGSNTINTAMETATSIHSPIIIQLSNGGAAFHAGKSLNNDHQRAAISGAKTAAYHIQELAEAYGATVILHTDHCTKKLLPWINGLLTVNEEHYKHFGKTLFSSHMLDFSEEPLEENIQTCRQYFERMNKIEMTLEIELGITGGEEDGVDNTEVDNTKLYTQPREVAYAYEKLREISPNFTIAAAFGNIHGVYKPGNVSLRPNILDNSQRYVQEKFHTPKKPIHFVFHGGSGSSLEEIREAINYGVVKMNIDTDLQYAFMTGIQDYMKQKKDFLQDQIGNPEDLNQSNKKYYDPRVWLREGENTFKARLKQAFEDLNNVNTLG
ncbi:MAG: class II fructose-bisphosphate aldolase [Flavobacteriales bacterium AspAUS03]